MEKNINYYIVEANKCKLGGYKRISSDFVHNLIDFLYDGKSYKNRLHSKVDTNLERFTSLLYSDVIMDKLFLNKASGLISSNTSPLLKSIYVKAMTIDVYKEFAFVLFLLGIVDPYDYLRTTRNVGFVMSKFSIGNGNSSAYRLEGAALQRLGLKYKLYVELMSMYFKLSMEGVDFGFSPFDFVYHIMGAVKKFDRSRVLPHEQYLKVYEVLVGYDFSMCAFIVEKLLNDKNVVDKYKEEVFITLPIFMGYKCICTNTAQKVFKYLRSRVEFGAFETVVRLPDFISYIGNPGVVFKEG